jgi:tetrapyrrole methylase family protein/MazG family protein
VVAVAAAAVAHAGIRNEPLDLAMSSLQILDPDEPYFFDPTVAVEIRGLESEERRARAYTLLKRSLKDTDSVLLTLTDGSEIRGVVSDLINAGALQVLRTEPVAPFESLRSISGARAIIARLRGPGGCPWDREQTPESLIRFVLEEAYEVADAIRHGSPAEIADELGDLLLQVLLQSEIASESGQFSFDDVLEALDDKLIRRHPHVFSDVEANTTSEVLKNWDALKAREKPPRKSVLDGAGKGLPALMAAQASQRRLSSVGFDWPEGGAWHKLEEELQELREAQTPEEIEHELGDVIYMAARIGLDHDIDAEGALLAALGRVRTRFQYVERSLAERQQAVSDVEISELESLWAEAKAIEKARL